MEDLVEDLKSCSKTQFAISKLTIKKLQYLFLSSENYVDIIYRKNCLTYEIINNMKLFNFLPENFSNYG